MLLIPDLKHEKSDGTNLFMLGIGSEWSDDPRNVRGLFFRIPLPLYKPFIISKGGKYNSLSEMASCSAEISHCTPKFPKLPLLVASSPLHVETDLCGIRIRLKYNSLTT